MNIPSRRRSHGNNLRSTPNSFIEGLAASYQRTLSFEALDTRARRDSAPVEDGDVDDLRPSQEFRSRVSSIQEHARVRSVQEHARVRSVQEHATVRSVQEHGTVRSIQERATVSEDEEAVTESTRLLSASETSESNTCRSTTLQTTFNIVNLLIGIGLLSLPLGMKLAGWILGIMILLLGAGITGYTAILLSRSLDTRPEAYAYSDIGAMAYGGIMNYLSGLIFVLELTAAGSALMILFSDNFHAAVPIISSGLFKVICLCIMLPATLLPLRILSYTSIIGILSTVILIAVVLFDGLYKAEAPGSLRDPLPTSALPSSWSTFPLSIGLLMASFGGHGIFPQVYTDMQDRRQFAQSVWIAYAFSTAVCIFMGVIGYMMFGSAVEAEITINISRTVGYPGILNKLAILLTAITSLTKVPLTTKSISANIDVFLGLRTLTEEKKAGNARIAQYLAVRVLVNLGIFSIAFFFPAFERVMSVLGSAFVFLISVILPVLFYIRIMDKCNHDKLTAAHRYSLWTLILLSSVVASIGTIWAFLPTNL